MLLNSLDITSSSCQMPNLRLIYNTIVNNILRDNVRNSQEKKTD